MDRNLVLVAYVAVLWTTSSVSSQEVPSRATDALLRETMIQMVNAQLSPQQIAQIQALAARVAPEIRNAERNADPTPAQQHARDLAIGMAAEKGLRGAAARELLNHATDRTDAQRNAFQSATRLRQNFDQAVIGLLTQTQRAAIQRPTERDDVTSGFLIVQLSANLPLPPRTAETLDAAAAALDLPRLQAVIAQFHLSQSARAVKPELLDRLEKADNPSISSEIRQLRTFWQIDISSRKDIDIKAVLQSLTDLPEVQEAYAPVELDEPATCSSVHPSGNTYYYIQGYLDPAPLGIDAAAAWNLPGGQGSGVGLVDLERGWNIDHEDLKAHLSDPVYGQRKPGNDHGTSVVGEIAATDNTVGIVGAAPCIDYVALTSRYQAFSGTSDPHVANALIAALFFMDPGDVVVLEAENKMGFPVEVETLNYLAIRLAVLSGMVVIEPAGNGNKDLDAFVYRGSRILDRSANGFRDSGAIIVGASDPTNGHNKSGASCFGSRVDCFGWGNYVTTTSCHTAPDLLNSGQVNDDKCYRAKFNGTSSAAPIVAGAALLVQGLWKRKSGAALNSIEMRKILSNPVTGTAQGTIVHGHIGVMPNLKSIIASTGLGAAGAPTAPACQCVVDCRIPRRKALRRARSQNLFADRILIPCIDWRN